MSEPMTDNHAQLPIETWRANLHRIMQTLSRDDENADGRTPLMLAVLRDDLRTMENVEMRLSDGADIEATDNNGQSALQMAFSSRTTNPEIVKKFLRTMQTRHRDNDELVEKLFEAGCQLYHASFLRDVQVTEGLLARGVRDVDWAGYNDKTALLVAASSNQLHLLTCLSNAGANVNVVDRYGRSALHFAAINGNAKMLGFLLESGGDANARATGYFEGLTPFGTTLLRHDQSQTDECAEMLLLRGAVPSQRIGDEHRKLLDEANDYKMKLLIGYAALRESQGDKAIAETIMECDRRDELPEYRIKYEQCRGALKTKVFEGLTLLDLLSASEAQFRSYARRESLYEALTRFQMNARCGNDKTCVYYYRALEHRMSKALPRFLEDAAILMISRLFAVSFGQCYVFGRRVVEYLSRPDVHGLRKALAMRR